MLEKIPDEWKEIDDFRDVTDVGEKFIDSAMEKAQDFGVQVAKGIFDETGEYVDKRLVDSVVGYAEHDAVNLRDEIFSNDSMVEAMNNYTNEVYETLKEDAVQNGKELTDDLLAGMKEKAVDKCIDQVVDVFAGEAIKLFRMVNDTVKMRAQEGENFEGHTFKEQLQNAFKSYKETYQEDGLSGVGVQFAKGMYEETINVGKDYWNKSTTPVRFAIKVGRFAWKQLRD
jgi:hypothetical protein